MKNTATFCGKKKEKEMLIRGGGNSHDSKRDMRGDDAVWRGEGLAELRLV